MVFVLLNWIFIFITLFGVGNTIRKIFPSLNHSNSLFLILIQGLIGTGIVTEIIRIFGPLQPTAYFILIPLTLIGLWWSRNEYTSSFNSFSKLSKIQLTLIILSGCFIAIECIKQPTFVDSGNYHFQSIKNVIHFGSLKGVGNILPHFGFHSSFFTLSGYFLFDITDSDGTQHIYCHLNGFAFLFVITYFICLLNNSTYAISLLILICFLRFSTLFHGWISNASPDVFGNAFVMLFCIWIFVNKEKTYENKILLILPLFLLTIKISFGPLCLLYVLLLFDKEINANLIKYLKPILLFGVCIVIPWVINHYLQSGYLIYPYLPSPLTNPEWSIPEPITTLVKSIVVNWAQTENYQLAAQNTPIPFNEWFPIWLKKEKTLDIMVFCLPILMSPFLIIFKNLLMINFAFSIRKGLMISALIGFVLWFIGAPDLRFTFGYIYPMCLFPFLIIMRLIPISSNLTKIFSQVSTILIVIILIAKTSLLHFDSQNLVHNQALKQPEIKLLNAHDSRIKIHATTDPSEGCWYTGILCSNLSNRYIEFIGDDLSDGVKQFYPEWWKKKQLLKK